MRRLATMAAASHALRLGPVALRPAQVALETPLSVVIRDLRPVLPGHVVVAPKRPVERYADLTEEEGDDLAVAIRRAQQLTPAADAFNVALKDGTSAGQPVAHVHAHVVPRVKGDLANNDEIYGLIDGWTPLDACGAPVTLDVPDDAARKPRSAEDMAAEAARYRRRGDPFPEPADVAFGPFAVDASQVFFESGTCRALVNLKPLVAGHVLVVPKAVVPTLGEMDEALHRDLWRAARRVHALITAEYGATGANVAVQDGAAAGQSVPHAHVHVLPRR